MNTLFLVLILILFLVASVFLAVLYIRQKKAYNDIYLRYKDVVDLDAVVKKRKAEIGALGKRILELKEEYKKRSESLSKKYQKHKQIFERLLSEIRVIEEDLESASFGLYRPHYEFDTSEKYKKKLDAIRKKQKDLIKFGEAIICRTKWIVSGSEAKGEKQNRENSKLMLRAFNGECDAAVLKVKWNNIVRLEERITKACKAINKLGTVMDIDVTSEYLDLKIEELRLTHEYQEKLYEEKEEQKRIRQQMREEEKARREIEKARQDAEAEEKRYAESLAKAREDIAKATGSKVAKLNDKIAALEKRLEEARELKERAKSRAELTRSGHVYVVSNVGSFGENIYKIGMTRRLDPTDRVKELGDASVPFSFDTHAIIYSEDAPGLENTLHKAFTEKRLNMINMRKEFFSVSLDEIQDIVTKNHGEIEFTLLAEAREYRETLALLSEAQNRGITEEALEQFPESLF